MAVTAELEVLGESSPRGLEIADEVAALTITSRADFLQAIEFVRHVKLKRLRIEKELGPAISNAYKAHKSLVGLRRSYDSVLAEAEHALKGSACEWVAAETHREELEAKDREAAGLATAAAMRQAKAEELRSVGDAKGADALLGQPLGPLPPVVRRPNIPAVEGVSFSSKWGAVVTDFAKLVDYCSANPQWNKLLQSNQKEITKLVRALHGNMEFPGIEVTEGTRMSVSTSKDGTVWDQ